MGKDCTIVERLSDDLASELETFESFWSLEYGLNGYKGPHELKLD